MKNISITYRSICFVFAFAVLLQTGFNSFSIVEKEEAKTEQSNEGTTISANLLEAVIPVASFEINKIVVPSVFTAAIQHNYFIKYKKLFVLYISYFDNLFQSSIQTLAP